MAELATGNREDALDLVQDAMLGLVKSYLHRDEQEWGPLFYRILQNRIRDRYRRNRVRDRFRAWLGFGVEPGSTEEPPDPLQQLPDTGQPDAVDALVQADAIDRLQAALQLLPLRQQQAFLLRAWEGLDTAATAFAMGCSEGSVKSHYSRAIHRLRGMLEEHWS